MAVSPPSYSPGRPPSAKDLELLLNGDPQPLGILTSTGTAVNNLTTTVPFNTGNLLPNGLRTLSGSLAGRVLAVYATAAGFFLTSSTPLIAIPTVLTVATSGTIPPVVNTFPGVPISAGEVKFVTMSPTSGWFQWISTSGTASMVFLEMI